MRDYKSRFFELALSKGNLGFGSFTLKSGRVSPYFFNAGGFDDGASLGELARCYADAILDSGIDFDMLFGPAYKGIPLAAATAVALNEQHGRNVPYAFNRKEAKDHGEGGTIVGAPLAGKVLVIDDVISAGTSVRESIAIIQSGKCTNRRNRHCTGPPGTRYRRTVRRPAGQIGVWDSVHGHRGPGRPDRLPGIKID